MAAWRERTLPLVHHRSVIKQSAPLLRTPSPEGQRHQPQAEEKVASAKEACSASGPAELRPEP